MRCVYFSTRQQYDWLLCWLYTPWSWVPVDYWFHASPSTWFSTVLQYVCSSDVFSQRCIAHVVHHTASGAMYLRMRHTCSLLCGTFGACWSACDTPRTLLEPRHVTHKHAIVLVVSDNICIGYPSRKFVCIIPPTCRHCCEMSYATFKLCLFVLWWSPNGTRWTITWSCRSVCDMVHCPWNNFFV